MLICIEGWIGIQPAERRVDSAKNPLILSGHKFLFKNGRMRYLLACNEDNMSMKITWECKIMKYQGSERTGHTPGYL
jgi:hypothetical protein